MFGKLLKKKDIVEESRDHNPGTANAFLYGGFLCGLLTLCADMAKGFLPVFLYLGRVAEPDIAGLALVLAFTFIFFSVVLRIRLHYYRTILIYLTALILMLVFCRVRPVKIGFGLIVLSVMIRMATSREEKGAFEVKLLWRRCFCPEGASARDRFRRP